MYYKFEEVKVIISIKKYQKKLLSIIIKFNFSKQAMD